MHFKHLTSVRRLRSNSTRALMALSPKLLAPAMALCLTCWVPQAAAQGVSSNGCTVLLCLAGNWRAISACVPPVRQALRDLMRGRALPFCSFASPQSLDLSTPGPAPVAAGIPAIPVGAQQATQRWSSADFCPVQYRLTAELEAGTSTTCSFSGAIEVTIGGNLWSRTWWNMNGDTVTEWTSTARPAFPAGAIDDQFERDFLAWQQRQQERATPPESETGAGA